MDLFHGITHGTRNSVTSSEQHTISSYIQQKHPNTLTHSSPPSQILCLACTHTDTHPLYQHTMIKITSKKQKKKRIMENNS